MQQFLKTVAKGYIDKYPDISRLTFIMPNIRSGSFLLKNIKDESDKPRLGPRVVPISDFIAENVEEAIDSRLDLLFRLYKCYIGLEGSPKDLSFEKFSSWGETLLNDFNETEMHMVKAEELFKNVMDLNEIQSDFLTDEQKDIMVEYFGADPTMLLDKAKGEKGFWKNIDWKAENAEKGKARNKFRSLWQQMYPLFNSFRKNLVEAGLTTEGGAYRKLALKIEKGYEPYKNDKIVFVGFNALSESERRIFAALKKMKIRIGDVEEDKADFVWDEVASIYVEEMDPAQKFIRINSRKDRFPMPDWLEEKLHQPGKTEFPEIEIISVPSNVMQAKVAARELEKMKESISDETIKNARIAVILPDENLLLPVLYSLPQDYGNPNLTMGFPLKQTPVISFARLLKKLHLRSKKSGDVETFYFEDVKDLLGHPYSRVLFKTEKIAKFVREYVRKKRLVVTAEDLGMLGENAPVVFTVFQKEDSPLKVIDYIYKLFMTIIQSFGKPVYTYLRSQIEETNISTYLDALTRLSTCLSEHEITISTAGVFTLADRLIAAEKVTLEGEPLQGLQVMGVLETRCLDFDRIIMLSVNEKVMPRVGRNSTFVPNSVRGVFGLPPANYQEEIFAYYFFRLLGRTSRAILTYDSRTSEKRTGGMSRYLLQMKYLSPEGAVKEREVAFGMPSRKSGIITIEKKEDILERLARYKTDFVEDDETKKKKFSPSSINNYLKCSLKFYYQNVMEKYVEVQKIESIDSMDLGTIVHGTMEQLYMPQGSGKLLSSPVVLTKDDLKKILTARTPSGQLLVEDVTRRMILKVHFHEDDENKIANRPLTGSAAIIFNNIIKYVKDIIKADIEQAPIKLWGCEIEENLPLRLADGREVNMKMVIDRLDQVGEHPDPPFRIVDYKTGSVHLSVDSPEEIFGGTYKTSYIVQLLVYSELFLRMLRSDKGKNLLPGIDRDKLEQNLQMVIYNVPKITTSDGLAYPEIGAEKIKSLGEFRDKIEIEEFNFMQELDKTICEILDPAIPFESEPNEERCLYCDYKYLCEVEASKRGDGKPEK